MQNFVFISFLVAFFWEFFIGIAGAGRVGNLVFDGYVMIMVIVVILFSVSSKLFMLPRKYQLLLFFVVLHVLGGVLYNAVPPGAIVVGLRVYLKYVPFLFIPLVFAFSDVQIERQLKFIVALALVQLPIALFQRFVSTAGSMSGDGVVGSLSISSFLSVFLVCVAAMITACYVKGRLSIKQYLTLLFCLCLPTTLNETKGTMFMLPIAVMVPVFLGGLGRESIKKFMLLMSMLVIFFGAFVVAYDYFYSERYNRSLVDVIANPEYLMMYLVPESTDMSEKRVGKLDKVIKPFTVMSEDDKLNIVVGLGLGNVTSSPVSSIAGEYLHYYDLDYVGGTVSYILWELGVVGVLLLFVFIIMLFVDAFRMRKQDNMYGVLALGMTAVCFLIIQSFFYKNVMLSAAIVSSFLYVSGVLISRVWLSQRRVQ